MTILSTCGNHISHLAAKMLAAKQENNATCGAELIERETLIRLACQVRQVCVCVERLAHLIHTHLKS